MRSPILYFFLLVLGISLNFGSNACYKQDKFSETLPKKGLELVPSKKSTIAFDLGFVLLQVKIDPIAKKQSCKRNVFRAYGTGRIKIILALPTKVIALYM